MRKLTLAIFLLLLPLISISEDRLIVCGAAEVFIIPFQKDVKKSDAIWSWQAKDSPSIPEQMHGLFRSTDECKPIGDFILITSSSSGVALIRRSDKKCLFLTSSKNAHSACLMPGDRVAVAASFGGDQLQVFDRSETVYQPKPVSSIDLYGAHGVLWDANRQRIWALGTDVLLLVKFADNQLSIEKTYQLPTKGGHDLSFAKEADTFFISTDHHVYRFNAKTGEFRPMHPIENESKVKSVDQHPTHGRTVWHKGSKDHWSSDTIRFLDPEQTIILPDERIYKVRWDSPLTDSNEIYNSEWKHDEEFDAFHFKTTVLSGSLIAHDKRDLRKGFGRHGLRNMTFKGIDLNAPEGPVGAKRRHQGLLNLYRVYGANETFGSLRDEEASVEPMKDGARLTWAATEDRPVDVSATYSLTGPAQIDVTIESTPTRNIKNFEILPATYLPVEWEKYVYIQRSPAVKKWPAPTLLRPLGNEEDDLKYPFFPYTEAARAAQEQSGRITSSWLWKTIIPKTHASYPVVFGGSEQVQVLQFADPDSVSAVCATPKPEGGNPEDWNSVEQHSALYFSLFGRDVAAGETVTSRIRLLVIDTPKSVSKTHQELYEVFLQNIES